MQCRYEKMCDMTKEKEVCCECYKCYWYQLNNDTGNDCFGYQMPCIEFKRKEDKQDD